MGISKREGVLARALALGERVGGTTGRNARAGGRKATAAASEGTARPARHGQSRGVSAVFLPSAAGRSYRVLGSAGSPTLPACSRCSSERARLSAARAVPGDALPLAPPPCRMHLRRVTAHHDARARNGNPSRSRAQACAGHGFGCGETSGAYGRASHGGRPSRGGLVSGRPGAVRPGDRTAVGHAAACCCCSVAEDMRRRRRKKPGRLTLFVPEVNRGQKDGRADDHDRRSSSRVRRAGP